MVLGSNFFINNYNIFFFFFFALMSYVGLCKLALMLYLFDLFTGNSNCLFCWYFPHRSNDSLSPCGHCHFQPGAYRWNSPRSHVLLSSPSGHCKKCIYRAVFGDQRLSELSHSHVLLYFFILPSSPLSSVRAVGSNVQVRCRRCPPLTPPLPLEKHEPPPAAGPMRGGEGRERERRGKTAAGNGCQGPSRLMAFAELSPSTSMSSPLANFVPMC